ncbi:MAG: hypothetical protein MK194_14185 [Roseibacillus sp.]|nr:hypothetical protein [Roseibacillus sp.]
MSFWSSLGANAVLAAAYVAYQLVNRCLHSKCRYNKEGGLDFDLGEPMDAATDMEKIAELIRQRSEHHKKVSDERTASPV